MIEKVEDSAEQSLQPSSTVLGVSAVEPEHQSLKNPTASAHSSPNRQPDQARSLSTQHRDIVEGSVQAPRDPEKGLSNYPRRPSHCTSVACSDSDSERDEHNDLKRNAVWILVY